MYRYNGEGRADWISTGELKQCNNLSGIFPVTWEEIGDELGLVTGYQGPYEGEILNLTEVVLCEIELRGCLCVWTKDLKVSYRKLQRLIRKVNPQGVFKQTGLQRIGSRFTLRNDYTNVWCERPEKPDSRQFR